MTYKANQNQIAGQALVNTQTAAAMQTGTVFSGSDPGLGFGEFVYVQGTGTVNAGDWVEFTQALASGVITLKVQQWAGTANSGKSLGVALAILTGNLYGWVQVYGNAIANISGTVAAGDGAYWNAAGQTKSAAVASKQVLNAQATAANNASINGAAIGAGFAVYFLNYPIAQGAIT